MKKVQGNSRKENLKRESRLPLPEGMKKFEFKFNINVKRMLLWLLILFLFVPFIVSLFQIRNVEEEIALSQALTDIKAGKVEKILIKGLSPSGYLLQQN